MLPIPKDILAKIAEILRAAGEGAGTGGAASIAVLPCSSVEKCVPMTDQLHGR
ncbi:MULTISPECIES: hypothetical protein [Pseudomonas]|uniref:Uncharacterized protein n=1 Tax=Pseudomonas viridiflava TaxID=33069 RepID=A0ABU7NFT9_PSEVI|nr:MULTISPECIES: hypothetical protein [Pseudomonas]MCI3909285.1 hypothetical protein [Pseudomonas viridiflava]MCJ8179382.1 hypothetical protein [Pseudomonas viridiflava]MCQ9393612.1 hypothetical protein [Pseudomonas viridiflava]MDY0937176.1 hypothetical protein [Pseudomonas viridiflava]MDY1012530.1 hypothetical protein [Pseudomonas viridiflava]